MRKPSWFTRHNLEWSLPFASMLIGAGFALAATPPAEAATPCHLGWSINTTSHRVTVYNEPFDMKGNAFRVVYTDGLHGKHADFHPKQASGIVTANILDLRGETYVGIAYWGWRNGRLCAGSGAIVGDAG